MNECPQEFTGMTPSEVRYMKKCTGLTHKRNCFLYSQRIGLWKPLEEDYQWSYECLSEPVSRLSLLSKKKLGKILNMFSDKCFLFSSKQEAIKAAKIIKVHESLIELEENGFKASLSWDKNTKIYVCLKDGDPEEV